MTALAGAGLGPPRGALRPQVMVERSLGRFVVMMAAHGGSCAAPWHVFALRAFRGFFAGYGRDCADDGGGVGAGRSAWRGRSGWCRPRSDSVRRSGPSSAAWWRLRSGLRETLLVAAALYLVALVLVFVGYREEAPARRPRTVRPPPVTFGGRARHSRTSSCSSARLRAAVRRSELRAGAAALPRRDRSFRGACRAAERRHLHDRGRRRGAGASPARQLLTRWRGRRLVAMAAVVAAGRRRGVRPRAARRRGSSRLLSCSASGLAWQRRRSTPRPASAMPVAQRGVVFGLPDDGVARRPGRESGRCRFPRRAEHPLGLRGRRRPDLRPYRACGRDAGWRDVSPMRQPCASIEPLRVVPKISPMPSTGCARAAWSRFRRTRCTASRSTRDRTRPCSGCSRSKGGAARAALPLIAAEQPAGRGACGPLDSSASRLAATFWPGPLSLVLRRARDRSRRGARRQPVAGDPRARSCRRARAGGGVGQSGHGHERESAARSRRRDVASLGAARGAPRSSRHRRRADAGRPAVDDRRRARTAAARWCARARSRGAAC